MAPILVRVQTRIGQARVSVEPTDIPGALASKLQQELFVILHCGQAGCGSLLYADSMPPSFEELVGNCRNFTE